MGRSAYEDMSVGLTAADLMEVVFSGESRKELGIRPTSDSPNFFGNRKSAESGNRIEFDCNIISTTSTVNVQSAAVDSS